jgi:O-antigen/teichoic acid export membrane protein
MNLKAKFQALVLETKSSISFNWLKIFDYFLVVLLLFSSGYCITSFSDSSYRTILVFVTFAFSFVRYFSTIDINFVRTKIQTKSKMTVLPSVWMLLIIGIGAVLTLFVNHETASFMSYVHFGFLVLSAFFLCRIFDIKRFVQYWGNILFALSALSLFIYFIYLFSGMNFGNFTFSNGKAASYSSYLYLFFQNINSKRIQGFFWEPGLFASFLILTILLELSFFKEVKWFHFSVFSSCLVLTLSTAGYFLYLLVLLLLFNKLIASKKIKIGINVFFGLSLLVVVLFYKEVFGILGNYFPSLFGKISDVGTSLTTRLESPLFDLKIFLQNIFLGSGIQGANADYQLLVSQSSIAASVDSQTSTSAFYLAAFGLFGGFYTLAFFTPLFDKKLSLSSKIIIPIAFFLIINKEPHTQIMFSWFFAFAFVKEAFDDPVLAKKYVKTSSPVPIFAALFSRDDNGNLARNIISTFALKGSALIIGFFSIPIYSLYFADNSLYGVWLTILSILSWALTFDFGFGNGMKNKLIRAFSINDKKEAKKVISSTYFPSFILSLAILLGGLVLINLIDLNSLLNVSESEISHQTLALSLSITFIAISLEFTLKNIITVFEAQLKHGLANSFSFISSALLFFFVLFCRFDSVSDKILFVSIAYLVTSIVPLLLGNLIAFVGPLRDICPSLKAFSDKTCKSILSIGFVYFMIQLCLLFLNSTDQFIISNIFGPDSVVVYTKYMKLFNVFISFFTIFSVTMWSFVYKAVVQKEFYRLKKLQLFSYVFAALFSALCLLAFFFLQPIMDLWLGDSTIGVNWIEATSTLVFSIVYLFAIAASGFSNGLQALKPQIIVLLICSVIKIPAIYAIHFFAPAFDWTVVLDVDVVLWLAVFIVLLIYNSRAILSFKQKKITNEEKQ